MNYLEIIKDKANIVDIISEKINVIKKGRNIKALCPFHDDKNPSLVISESKQLFKCFSCGMGGDVVKFLMEFEKISFKEALKILAERYNVALPSSFNLKDTTYIDLYLLEKTINQITANTYHDYLYKGAEASLGRKYLIKRKINQEALTTFKIGYAPNKKDFLLNILKKKYSPEKIIKTTLVKKNYYNEYIDFFFTRVIFPIVNEKNEVLGFGGRALKEKQEPKYLNSLEAPWFKKREILYGFRESYQNILKKRAVYLVEGYFDVIAFYQIGLPAVAPLGTSFTKEQVTKIKRYVDKVFLVFDSDPAGVTASLKAIRLLMENEVDGYIITLPAGQDPFDVVSEWAEEKVFDFFAKNQKPIQTYLLDYYNPHKQASPVLKKEYLQEILQYYQVIRDKYLKQNFAEEIEKLFRIAPEKYYQQNQQVRKPVSTPAKKNPSLTTKERELIIFLCNHPSYLNSAKAVLKSTDFEDSFSGYIYKKLILHNNPDFIKIENILKLFAKPDEKVIVDFIISKVVKTSSTSSNQEVPQAENVKEEFENRISFLKLENLKNKIEKINIIIKESIKENNDEKREKLQEEKEVLTKEKENLENFLRSSSF